MTKSSPHISFIGIGSNLGPRSENIGRALELLQKEGISVEKISCLYETEAMENCKPCGQPPFLNAAAQISTPLSPWELLRRLTAVEAAFGRPHPRKKNEPRAIDLDVLFFDDIALDSPAFKIPHPEIEKRLFVLVPLCDIAPSLSHPVLRRTIAEMERDCRNRYPMKIVQS